MAKVSSSSSPKERRGKELISRRFPIFLSLTLLSVFNIGHHVFSNNNCFLPSYQLEGSYPIQLATGKTRTGRSSNDPPDDLLSEKAIQVLLMAPKVDLTFVPLSRDKHPHMGALDEKNRSGYIPDITTLHQNPPPFLKSPEDCHDMQDKEQVALERLQVSQNYGNTHILCAIYSASPFHDKLQAARHTWAPQCDGFLVASNVMDQTVNAVHIPHVGPEDYGNMWQKVRSIWSYIYHSYYEEYDWFHLGGDDMYIIVENLRAYLTSHEIRAAAGFNLQEADQQQWQRPLYLGQKFYNPRKSVRSMWILNTGGPGYTLNKAALKLLVTEGLQNPEHMKRTTSMEDVVMGKTFFQMGVEPYPTTDRYNRQRYHHITAGDHYSANFRKEKWYPRLSWWNETGENVSSTESIAFHYVDDALMRRYHAVLHGLCD